MSHTPGPWTVRGPYQPEEIYISCYSIEDKTSWGEIAILPTSNNATEIIEKQKYNAHLIAAAPELLEALEYAISAMHRLEQTGHHAPWITDTYSILRRAINKAKGK